MQGYKYTIVQLCNCASLQYFLQIKVFDLSMRLGKYASIQVWKYSDQSVQKGELMCGSAQS